MQIYNSLTSKKEPLATLEPNKVKMYACGPTVYNYIHIGNARQLVVFDAVRRYLEYKGYTVTYAQNYTDVDDRIIQRAVDEGVTYDVISERYIAEVEKDMQGLNVMRPDISPKATEEIETIIQIVQTLVGKGNAYVVDGSVFFDTKSFSEYGKLSKRNFEDDEAGARIKVDESKRDPMDFVLWKPAKSGEPYWESPWSNGRPGWHIECSAMILRYLGEEIDIHGGGDDLLFPHHENEIAQSEAANGKQLARFFMHNAMINIENQKMSKSKGNFYTLRELAERSSYEVVRFYILTAHYRSPLNFSLELLDSAKNGLTRIKTCVENIDFYLTGTQKIDISVNVTNDIIEAYIQKFTEAMDDDFNTADAISVIFELVRLANKAVAENEGREQVIAYKDAIIKLCGILGIKIEAEESDGIDWLAVNEMVEQREQARRDKNFALADEIRANLLAMGIVIEDTKNGAKAKLKD